MSCKEWPSVLPLSLTVSASGEFESGSTEGLLLVAKILLIFIWGFEGGKSLLQHSPASQSIWVGGALIIGLLREKEDSASACSKKTYFTASSSARPRVITCSRSMLYREGPTSRAYSTMSHNRQIYLGNKTFFFTWRALEAACCHWSPAS